MAERIAYFDCFSGASGDMLLGALLDAGLSLDDLRADIAQLKLPGVELTLKPHTSHGISGSQFDVIDHAQEHPARNLDAVCDILGASDLAQDIIQDALHVFGRLAAAEAKVHGVDVQEVHFHELGAVDSLVDIVGFCCGLRRLGIARLFASPLPLGSGSTRTAHGLIPIPVPATLALLTGAGAPTIPSSAESELVTPTGAALLTTLARFERPAMVVEQVGYGFGRREMPWANMLRVWLGHPLERRHDTHRHPADDAHSHDHAHGPAGHLHAHEVASGADIGAHDAEHEHTHGPEHGHAH